MVALKGLSSKANDYWFRSYELLSYKVDAYNKNAVSFFIF